MAQFLQQIRSHFNVIYKGDYLSLTLINPNINLQVLNFLKDKFKLLNQIRREEIIILQCEEFNDELLIVLAQSLPSSLTELSLDFTGCEGIKGSGLLDLFQNISRMQNLMKLHLDFSQIYDINDFVLEGLSMLLQSLSQLTDFYLDLYEVDQISEDGYLILAQSITHLQNVQKFYLDLSANPNLTEDSLELLFSNLPTKLSYLGIRILDIQHIGGGSFFKLAEKINEMKQLRQINLTLSTFLNLNHKGVYSIIKSISSLTHLKKITLNLSNTNLPQKMLSYFSFPQILQSLTLDVSCNPNLSDRDIISLMQKIPTLHHLKSVSFNFDFCKKITEDALEMLVEKVCENCSLQKLSLNDRKYSYQFGTNCVQIIKKSNCFKSFLMLNISLIEETEKKQQIIKYQTYKSIERIKRNIIFASHLVKNNKYLKSFQKDIVSLLVP